MFVGYETWRIQAPYIDVDLFAIHTAVNVTVIHLYKDINEEEATKAMRTVLSLIRQLNDADYEFLDPTLSVSRALALVTCRNSLTFVRSQAAWTCVAKEYMRMIAQAEKSPGGSGFGMAVAELELHLNIICNAMTMMTPFFPIAGKWRLYYWGRSSLNTGFRRARKEGGTRATEDSSMMCFIVAQDLKLLFFPVLCGWCGWRIRCLRRSRACRLVWVFTWNPSALPPGTIGALQANLQLCFALP